MVEVLESSFVVPSEPTATETLRLSNIDQVAPPVHVGFVYFYQGNQAKDFFSVETLKASLSRTLVLLYPLAGRCVVGQDGRKEINCNAEGCLFVAARSDLTSDEIKFEPSSELQKLFLPSADFPESLSLLVMIQVTYLKCGGVVLGIATNYVLIDGCSAFYFIQTWAAVARGDVAKLIPPSFDRNLLRGRTPPRVTFNHPEYTTDSIPAAAPKCCLTARFTLSRKQIQSLKSRHSGGSIRISSFSTIAALVWKCYCISKGLGPSTQTRLIFVADVRRRLSPPLPKTYIGNVVVRTSAVSEVSTITSKPVHVVAEIVQSAVDGITDDFVRSFIDYLEVMQGKILHSTLELAESDLRISSISGLPIYEANFGWGAPQKTSGAVAPGKNNVNLLDELGNNNAGLLMYITLDATIMPLFEKAFYEELILVDTKNNGSFSLESAGTCSS
ncbi:HXXXD-type acyl-transferase family protein [Rhynchospora pubera]|uniref:HXXXD-type acyl-transferase family protein n=1 Tax=Rhynchospora pubera TaxID=906938 RepID=A0AAV8F9F5_9POAL|nr:HXXXD-type acyl-transferase family protein [Rhynchospora pubera]